MFLCTYIIPWDAIDYSKNYAFSPFFDSLSIHYVNRDPRYGTCVLTVNADGTCLLSFPERNDRVGYYYNYYIGENGEMVAVDENNDAVFSASMNDGNFLSDADDYLWYAE